MSVLKLYNKIANGKAHGCMFDNSTEVEAQCIIPPAHDGQTLIADQFFDSYSWSNKHGRKYSSINNNRVMRIGYVGKKTQAALK